MDLTGKRVLITAAAQGIGRASVEAYLAAGAKVIAADINQQALAGLPGAQTVVLDVTDASAIQRLASPSLQQRIVEQARHEGRQQDEVYAAFTARQPMGRLGTPQEIAQLALYLGSDASAFTTGTTQIIDGGWSN
eukprot:gene6939-8066_t